MKALPKLGLLVAVALLATAAIAVGAQAVEFNPPGEPVHGDATNPTLSYEGVTIVCATGTVDGTTSDPASDTIAGAAVDFFEPCTLLGQNATVECGDGASTVDLVAQADGGVGGSGTVNLNADFRCDVTVLGLCTITVVGPQTTQPNNLTLDEGNDETIANVNVAATRTGSSLCGPSAGTGNFTATYDTTPTNLTIDP
jgi:hypothetical protein